MLDPIITLYLLGQFQEGGGGASMAQPVWREVIPNVRFADRIEGVLSRQSSSRAMTARKDGKSRCTVSHTNRAATSS